MRLAPFWPSHSHNPAWSGTGGRIAVRFGEGKYWLTAWVGSSPASQSLSFYLRSSCKAHGLRCYSFHSRLFSSYLSAATTTRSGGLTACKDPVDVAGLSQ